MNAKTDAEAMTVIVDMSSRKRGDVNSTWLWIAVAFPEKLLEVAKQNVVSGTAPEAGLKRQG